MKKKTIGNAVIYLILILVSITMLVPFLWMFLTAFKTVAETTQVDPFVIIPSVWQTQNFSNVIKAMDFVRLYANTLGMVVLRILFAVLTATLSGYAFARLKFCVGADFYWRQGQAKFVQKFLAAALRFFQQRRKA